MTLLQLHQAIFYLLKLSGKSIVTIEEYSLYDVLHPETDEVLIEEAEYISAAKAKLIDESGVESVLIRSVLTCETPRGVCAKCYGKNLATGGGFDEVVITGVAGSNVGVVVK